MAMSPSSDSSNVSAQSSQPPAHLPKFDGLILQRGGEELTLDKVGDRFTLRWQHPSQPDAFNALIDAVQPMSVRQLTALDLVEMQVNHDRLDAVMEQVRSANGVAFASHVYAIRNHPDALVYLTDELTVQFAAHASLEAIAALTEPLGLTRPDAIAGLPQTYVFHVSPQAPVNPIKLANQLNRSPLVQLTEPNIAIQAQSFYQPSAPYYADQWYLQNTADAVDLVAGSHIFAEAAWELTQGDRSIVIAIIDDGFDLDHPAFWGTGKIVAPHDLRGLAFHSDAEASTVHHGTACAGLAIAEDNRVGMVGVAPGCALMPIQTSGFLDDRSIEQMFSWAIEHGAAVISCSWGPSAIYFPLSLRQQAAITRAATEGRHGRGCVVVFAAGNANRPINGSVLEQGWPSDRFKGITQWLNGYAMHPDVIAVAACTSQLKKAAYSNWGTAISVCAPSNNDHPKIGLAMEGIVETAPHLPLPLLGRNVLTSDRPSRSELNQPGYTRQFGGTSSACPIVAGVAALMLSINPDLTARDVKQLLQDSADKIIDPDADPQLGLRKGTYDGKGHSQWFGYGKVNAYRAVVAAKTAIAETPASNQWLQFSSATASAIPDDAPDGLTSALHVDINGRVRDLRVWVELEHSFLGDISLTLIGPQSRVLLQSRTLGRQTVLKTTYTLQTCPALRHMIGASAQGQWSLQVVDQARHHTGTLHGWQLELNL